MDIAEERRVLGGAGVTNRDRAAHSRLRLERPVHTARIGVERVDVPRVGADEDATGDDGRLAVNGDRPGQSECPLQLESRHLTRRQIRGLGGLESRVRVIDAPSVPGWRSRHIANRRITRAGVGHLPGVAALGRAHATAAHILGDFPLLLIGEARALVLHHPGGERLVDPFRRHLLDDGREWSGLHLGITVAGDAYVAEQLRAVSFRLARLGEGAAHG